MGSCQDEDRAAAAQFRHRHAPVAKEGYLASMSCDRRHTLNERLEKHVLSEYSPRVQRGVELRGLYQHQIPIKRSSTGSTSTSMTTSDTGELGGDDNTKSWKDKLAGDILDSTSGYRQEAVISNANHLLRRLKLDVSKDSDKCLSKNTTKMSSFAFQMQNQHNSSLSTIYYRPVDSLAKDRIITPPMRPLPTANSAKPVASVSRPSGLSVAVDSSSSRLRSTSYSPTRISPGLHHCDWKNDLRKVSLVKSASESDDDSDDDSVKRMETVTHTFQRTQSVTSRNSKVSAVPLSGIGVEVGMSDYKDDDQHHRLNTPRVLSCSITSFIDDIIGFSPTDECGDTSRRSPFDVIVSILFMSVMHFCAVFLIIHFIGIICTKRKILCSPNRPTADSAKDDCDRGARREQRSDGEAARHHGASSPAAFAAGHALRAGGLRAEGAQGWGRTVEGFVDRQQHIADDDGKRRPTTRCQKGRVLDVAGEQVGYPIAHVLHQSICRQRMFVPE